MKEQLSGRDRISLVFFFLILFLMGFLQYMQYFELSSKTVKNIAVLLIIVISLGAALTKGQFFMLDSKIFFILIFIAYALLVEFFTNTFTLENAYYLSVPFLTIIGGYSFGESYSNPKVFNIIKKTTLIVYILLCIMFFQNFLKIGFRSAGVQTSIVYPLMLFVLIGCIFEGNIILVCSVPMIYGGFLLMARSVILLTISVVLVKLLIGEKNKGDLIKKILLLSIFCFIGILLFQYVLKDTGANILEKGSTTGSDFTSGRNGIYIESINYFMQSSILKQLFGNGANTAVKLFGISGHSDFIQFLLNFGVVGMFWFAKILVDFIRAVESKRLAIVKYIEIAVLIFYITINQFFLTVGPSTLYGFIIGMFAGHILENEESGIE